ATQDKGGVLPEREWCSRTVPHQGQARVGFLDGAGFEFHRLKETAVAPGREARLLELRGDEFGSAAMSRGAGAPAFHAVVRQDTDIRPAAFTGFFGLALRRRLFGC